MRTTRSSQLLEIIYWDTCGPMLKRSNEGARFFITFNDYCNRWYEVYSLQKKSEAISIFLAYKNFVETFTGDNVRILQSDNGKEYCNIIMNKILKNTTIV